MQTIQRAFFYLFCFCLMACSFTPNEMKIAEQIIEDHPDSALNILKNLPTYKYKSGSNRALYGLLMIQTLDKKKLPLKPETLLNFSIAWYEEHPDGERLATCYLYKGRTYKYCSQYVKAMTFYLKALDKVQSSKNYILLGRINLDMGDIYNLQRDYLLARQKYKLSYTYFKNAKLQNLAFYSYLNVGRTYHEAKDYKSAQIIYQKTLFQAKDSMQQGALFQEMGQNFYDSGKYDSALVYFKKVINYPYIGNNRAIQYYSYADILFDVNEIDSAYYYAQKAFEYQPEIRTQRECYRILVNCESLKGNLKALNKYMAKYQDCTDSIRIIDSQTKGSVLETMHKTTNEAVKTKSKLWFLFVVLMLVIISAISIYIVKHRRNKKEELLIEQKHTQQKAQIRKDVILKKRDALLIKIKERKAEQSAEWKKEVLENRQKMDRKIYEELLHLNDVNFFYKEMDTILNNLVTKLKTRYPALTVKEIQWCCFHLLSIPTQDMLLLFDYKVDSLKKMKQRLINKVNLSSVNQLNDFLNAILSE